MSRLRPLLIVAATALALAALTGTASARTSKLSPIADCKAHNGTLTETYTLAQLQAALKQLSPSIREYTTCNAAISDAINASLGTKPITDQSPGSGGGGSGTVILIVVIIAVVLFGGGGSYWAFRRSRSAGPDPGTPA
jgi:hypothetical protein